MQQLLEDINNKVDRLVRSNQQSSASNFNVSSNSELNPHLIIKTMEKLVYDCDRYQRELSDRNGNTSNFLS